MADKEIKIAEYELADCEGNLKSIKSAWAAVPKISTEEIEESSGNSRNCIVDIIEVSDMIRASFDKMLDNTMSFFTELGIAFETADDEASKQINSITNK